MEKTSIWSFYNSIIIKLKTKIKELINENIELKNKILKLQ